MASKLIMADDRYTAFSSQCDNDSILHQTEKYFTKKNLLVIPFFRHITPFYNLKTEISKPNKK